MDMRWHTGSGVLHKAALLQQIPRTRQSWGKHGRGRESGQKEHRLEKAPHTVQGLRIQRVFTL